MEVKITSFSINIKVQKHAIFYEKITNFIHGTNVGFKNISVYPSTDPSYFISRIASSEPAKIHSKSLMVIKKHMYNTIVPDLYIDLSRTIYFIYRQIKIMDQMNSSFHRCTHRTMFLYGIENRHVQIKYILYIHIIVWIIFFILKYVDIYWSVGEAWTLI